VYVCLYVYLFVCLWLFVCVYVPVVLCVCLMGFRFSACCCDCFRSVCDLVVRWLQAAQTRMALMTRRSSHLQTQVSALGLLVPD